MKLPQEQLESSSSGDQNIVQDNFATEEHHHFSDIGGRQPKRNYQSQINLQSQGLSLQ